ncbi:MAG: hypothetical protein MK008_01545 [Bdellovibrionales bacterium]|nr:hypothetical protein [Bdellovibrionales bacterium]
MSLMLKSFLLTLIFVPSLALADTPLNFEYSLECFFDISCKKKRVNWAFQEMQAQFVKANYNYEQFLKMSVDESYSPYDRIQITTMNLKNYNQELNSFIQYYEFVLENAHNLSKENQQLVLAVSYILARLVIPDELEVSQEIVEQLPKKDQSEITYLQDTRAKLLKLASHQNVERDLMVDTEGNGDIFYFAYGGIEIQDMLMGVVAYSIEEYGVYVVSDLEVLKIVEPLVQASATKTVVDLDTYVRVKELERALKDFLEENSDKADEKSPKTVPVGPFN